MKKKIASFIDLKIRVLTSLCVVAVVGLLVCFSQQPVIHFVNALVMAALAITGVWEYLQFLKVKRIEQPFWLLAAGAALFVFANYLATAGIGESFVVNVVVIAFFFAIILYHFNRVEGAIIDIATCFFGSFYIVVPLGLLLRILYPETLSSVFVDGRLWFTYLIVVTKITDIGAYFTGKLWGKSKLAPHLSPGKTLAGAIGGFVSAVLLSLLFAIVSQWTPVTLFHLTFVQAIILGGVLGVFSQLGDLAESLLKRDVHVKDSNCLPGIGGVLDLLDSLLFTTPIVYLFLKTV